MCMAGCLNLQLFTERTEVGQAKASPERGGAERKRGGGVLFELRAAPLEKVFIYKIVFLNYNNGRIFLRITFVLRRCFYNERIKPATYNIGSKR